MKWGFAHPRRMFSFISWLKSRSLASSRWVRFLNRDTFYFKSYSQFGEDVLMHALFDGRPKFYVDVGSGHPIKGSNTYFMYRAGHRGLLIDPIMKNYDLSLELRPQDQIMLAGAGSKASNMEFFEFEPYQFSTFDPKIRDLRVSEGITYLRSTVIPIFPLSDLGLKSSVETQTFLSVDTEGFELEVLLGIDFEEFKPDVIVIEDWARESPRDETEIFHFLIALGYKWVSRLHFSDVYILPSSQNV